MTTFYLKKTNTAPRLPTNITGVGGVRISSLVEVRVCRRLQYTETVAYCKNSLTTAKAQQVHTAMENNLASVTKTNQNIQTRRVMRENFAIRLFLQ